MRGIRITGLAAIAALFATLTLAAPAEAGLGKIFGMSKSQEKEIAADMLEEFKQDPGLITSGSQYQLVQETGRRLVDRNGLDEYEYRFFLIKQDEINAFATPAGYIYVTQGLVEYMGYDKSMLAAVMAHELGHAKDRHVAKGYEKSMKGNVGLGVLGILLGEEKSDVVNVLGTVGGVALLKYNRDQEEWADRDGVELSYNAGYDAYGLMRSMQLLEKMYGSSDSISVWMQNHPSTQDRVKRTYGIAEEVSGREHGYMSIPKPKRSHPLYEYYGKVTVNDGFNNDRDDDRDDENDGDGGASSEKYSR